MSLALWCLGLLQLTALAAGVGARLARGGAPAATARVVRGLLILALGAPLLSLAGSQHAFRVGPQAAHTAAGAPVLAAQVSAELAAPIAHSMDWMPVLAGVLALAVSARVLAGVLSLLRALRGAVPMRRLGRVRVLASGRARVPFAAALPGRRYVVLDVATVGDAELSRVAVVHELAHHRRGDPLWAWFELLMSALAPFAAPLWRTVLDEAVELACDARVSQRLPARAYAKALLRAAENLAQTPVLARPAWASLLNRRITMLLSPSFSPSRTVLALALGLPLTLGVGLAADGRGLVAGPELSRALADASGDGFIVPDQPSVRAALDHFVSSDKGRAFLSRGLENRKIYGTLVDNALAEAGLPAQLAAIPLIESGYQSFDMAKGGAPQSMAPGSLGAGLWMFIPATARSYGLTVEPGQDERLDVVKETDAAVRLLSDLRERYGEWPLAIAAYNQGEKAVDQAIAEGGTRDAWALVEGGALNDYLPLVSAAAVLLERPEWVR